MAVQEYLHGISIFRKRRNISTGHQLSRAEFLGLILLNYTSANGGSLIAGYFGAHIPAEEMICANAACRQTHFRVDMQETHSKNAIEVGIFISEKF